MRPTAIMSVAVTTTPAMKPATIPTITPTTLLAITPIIPPIITPTTTNKFKAVPPVFHLRGTAFYAL
jgi:hypothetical protein